MDYKEKYKEIFNMRKDDLLYLIENLMIEGKIDITDITLCHTKFLESKLAMKDEQHRKWILAYLYDGLYKANEPFKGQFKTAIAWFEKQRNKE